MPLSNLSTRAITKKHEMDLPSSLAEVMTRR